MASSDNFPSTFLDPWISDPFSRETQSLTKALHRSLLPSDSDPISSFLDLMPPLSAPTPTVSGISADPDTPSTRPTPALLRPKLSKRKSRASKRNHTTFITADPANFRHMVQQVTGVRLGDSTLQIPPVLKPEPQRPTTARFPLCHTNAGLPTLDTSAFLLNHHHHHHHHQQQQSSGSGSDLSGPGPLSFPSTLGLPNNGPLASDYDTFPSFPTLESWKAVM